MGQPTLFDQLPGSGLERFPVMKPASALKKHLLLTALSKAAATGYLSAAVTSLIKSDGDHFHHMTVLDFLRRSTGLDQHASATLVVEAASEDGLYPGSFTHVGFVESLIKQGRNRGMFFLAVGTCEKALSSLDRYFVLKTSGATPFKVSGQYKFRPDQRKGDFVTQIKGWLEGRIPKLK